MYTIIERPDNNVQYIRIKNPKYKKDGKIKTESVFLCSWNGNDNVELHTAFTLKEVYTDLNMDSFFRNPLGQGRHKFKTLRTILDEKSDLVNVKFYKDNMTITKLK